MSRCAVVQPPIRAYFTIFYAISLITDCDIYGYIFGYTAAYPRGTRRYFIRQIVTLRKIRHNSPSLSRHWVSIRVFCVNQPWFYRTKSRCPTFPTAAKRLHQPSRSDISFVTLSLRLGCAPGIRCCISKYVTVNITIRYQWNRIKDSEIGPNWWLDNSAPWHGHLSYLLQATYRCHYSMNSFLAMYNPWTIYSVCTLQCITVVS